MYSINNINIKNSMRNNPLNSFIFPLHPYKNKNKDELMPFETRMKHSLQALKSELLYDNNTNRDNKSENKNTFLINEKPKKEFIDRNDKLNSLSNVDNRFFNRGEYFTITDRSHSRFTMTTKANSLHSETFSYYYLPMKSSNNKRKTLVLNFEGTIVNIDNNNIAMRPQLKEFLHRMKYYYEIVIYTSLLSQKVIEKIIKEIELSKYIDFILSKENCKEIDGFLVKDLKRIGRDIGEIVLIDDSLLSCEYNKGNSIPILKWRKDNTDIELFKLIPILEYLSKNDIRTTLDKIITKNGLINWKVFEEIKNPVLRY